MHLQVRARPNETNLKSELAVTLAKSILTIMNIANENIMQQQRTMPEILRQFVNAAEVRVQSDAEVAMMALANAKQIMFQWNAKELRRVVGLYHQTFTAKEVIYKEKFKVHDQTWDPF